MKLRDLIGSALWSFRARPARMGALCLALACALASVATLASVVAGYSRAIEAQTFGDLNRRIVVSENPILLDRFGPPRIDFIPALLEKVADVDGVAAWRSDYALVRHGENSIRLPLMGILDARGVIAGDLATGEGRTFRPEELRGDGGADRRVCLLGTAARRSLCPDDKACALSAIPEIYVNGALCTVVGVLAPPRRLVDQRFARAVITPFFSAARLYEADANLGENEAQELEIVMKPGFDPKAARAAIASTLRAGYGAPLSAAPPFEFADSAGASDILRLQRKTFSQLLLVVIAASGFGGFVTVASIVASMMRERRREIALRIAYGAHAEDIVQQFLVEMAAVALFGAMLSSAAVIGVGLMLDRYGAAPIRIEPALLADASALGLVIVMAAALPSAMGAAERRSGADRE